MNVFLIIVLVLSGLIELVVGLWALLVSTGLTDLWQPWADTLSDPPGILLFALGLASIYMAALHVTAIRWLQIEKQDGYPLSIALGIAITVFGVATYAYAQIGAGQVGNATYLFAIDGVRGAILALAGIAAMHAPATVTQLRVPGRRERPASRRYRDSSREGRDSRSRRTRDDDRSSRRSGQRRRGGGREGGGRSSRPRRDAQQPRAGSPDRDDRRRERTSVRGRGAASDPTETSDDLRRRRLSSREDGPEERDRRPVRRPRVPPLPETDDVRSLGVVVTGKRPDQRSTSPSDEEVRPTRSDPRRGRDERSQRPLAPMVPSLRTENGRSRRSDREDPDDDRSGRGGHSRGRHRRHRPSSRESSDREQIVGRSAPRDEPFDDPPRSLRDYGPSGNRLVTKAGTDGSGDASADHRRRELPRPEPSERPTAAFVPPEPASEPPVADPEPQLHEEPIDRISAFHSLEEKDAEDQEDGNGTAFGRNRRPFTPHRRGRQVKPRESKVRQSLGGNSSRETAETIPDPPAADHVSRDRRIRMENGIGPIDLDEPDSAEEE